MTIKNFQKRVVDYYKNNKRDFPWRQSKHFSDPYKVVVSEIMLQQTQTRRVIEKYLQFIKAIPSFSALHQTSQRDVLKLWQGLGYNRRALYLKRIAEEVVINRGGEILTPEIFSRLKKTLKNKITPECAFSESLLKDILLDLQGFSGIGEATAASVSVFIWNLPIAFIETNIRRVFIHSFFPRKKKNISDSDILKLVKKTLPKQGLSIRDWYYALMDYGVYLATITKNPNTRSKHYKKQSLFFKSERQIRGAIISVLTASGGHYQTSADLNKKLIQKLAWTPEKSVLDNVLKDMEREGFLVKIRKNRKSVIGLK